jgi:hypothetical protein
MLFTLIIVRMAMSIIWMKRDKLAKLSYSIVTSSIPSNGGGSLQFGSTSIVLTITLNVRDKSLSTLISFLKPNSYMTMLSTTSVKKKQKDYPSSVIDSEISCTHSLKPQLMKLHRTGNKMNRIGRSECIELPMMTALTSYKKYKANCPIMHPKSWLSSPNRNCTLKLVRISSTTSHWWNFKYQGSMSLTTSMLHLSITPIIDLIWLWCSVMGVGCIFISIKAHWFSIKSLTCPIWMNYLV